MVLSSCGSISIEKRRYRSGFTIHTSNHRTAHQLAQTDTVTVENTALVAKTTTESKPVKNSKLKTEEFFLATSNERITERSTDKVVNKTSLFSDVSSSIVEVKEVRQQQVNPVLAYKSTVKKKAQQSRSSGSLSFLGLLVLVLVILWLIAYFSGGWGLGGFVHLFLVVAAILLVLWLLGII